MYDLVCGCLLINNRPRARRPRGHGRANMLTFSPVDRCQAFTENWRARAQMQRFCLICFYLGPLGTSWGHLEVILGPLGSILGPPGAILGPSWALLGPSWSPLGASCGHLGSILGHLGVRITLRKPQQTPNYHQLLQLLHNPRPGGMRAAIK